jgi:hypothetical protein
VQSTYSTKEVSATWILWCIVPILRRECLRHGVFDAEYLFFGGSVCDIETIMWSTYSMNGVAVTCEVHYAEYLWHNGSVFGIGMKCMTNMNLLGRIWHRRT